MILVYINLIYYLAFYLFLSKIKKKYILIILGLFPLFMALAFQNAIGTDYYSYIAIFHKKVPFRSEKGVLFKLIVDFLKIAINHERSLFVVTAFIQMFLFYKIILKMYIMNLIKNIPLFIFITISWSQFYIQMFNILRNSIAGLFINLGILFLLENKKVKTAFIIFIGSLFHPSVIIWEFLIFIKNLFIKKINVLFFIIYWSFCIFLENIDFIRKICQILYESNLSFRYKGYLVSKDMFLREKTLGITILALFIIFIFSFFYYIKEKNKNKLFFYNMGYLSFGLSILFKNIPILSRILYPFFIYQTYIVYIVLLKLINKKYFYIGFLLIFFGVIYYLRGIYYIMP